MIKEKTSRTFRIALAAALMAASAVCLLKYSWWAACYSGWYGLQDYAQQLRDASIRVNIYWWSVVVLEAASVGVVWSLIEFRAADMPPFLKRLARFGAALILTAIGTGIFLGVTILLGKTG